MAKRLTKDQWKTLEKDFYKWCIAEGRVALLAFYKSLKKPLITQSGIEYRARQEGWLKQAQEKLDALEAPKLREKNEKLEKEKEEQTKALTVIELDKEESPLPESTPKAVKEVIKYVQDGLGYNVLGYTKMAKIVHNQIAMMLDKQETPVTNQQGEILLGKDGKPQYVPIDNFQAQACTMLINGLEKYHNIMRKSVSGNGEVLNELFSLEEKAIENLVAYKEKVKIASKETESDKNQHNLYKNLIEYSQDEHGIELGG